MHFAIPKLPILQVLKIAERHNSINLQNAPLWVCYWYICKNWMSLKCLMILYLLHSPSCLFCFSFCHSICFLKALNQILCDSQDKSTWVPLNLVRTISWWYWLVDEITQNDNKGLSSVQESEYIMYWNTKRNHTKCWTLFLAIFFSTQVSQLVRVKRSFLTKYRKGDCTIRVPLSDWKQIVSSLLSLDSWCFATEHDPLSSKLSFI